MTHQAVQRMEHAHSEILSAIFGLYAALQSVVLRVRNSYKTHTGYHTTQQSFDGLFRF